MVVIKVLKALFIVFVFLIGWYAHESYASDAFLNLTGKESPLSISIEDRERAYPGDWVEQDKIKVYDTGVILDITKAEWAEFSDTHSMEPTLGARSNAIQIIPKTKEEIKEGDIISYQSKIVQGTIIHRVQSIKEDELGWYVVTKGDNNSSVDPERVRFDQIERVVVAIVY